MMIFLRPAMCFLRRATGAWDLLLLCGERRGPVTLQQPLHLALRLLQFRCSRPGEQDALLERRDRLLQGEAASLQALHHPGEARDDVLVLLGDGLYGCVGHASPPSIQRAAFPVAAADGGLADHASGCTRHERFTPAYKQISQPSSPPSFVSSTCAESSPSCNRTRTRSPGRTWEAWTSACPRGSNATA